MFRFRLSYPSPLRTAMHLSGPVLRHAIILACSLGPGDSSQLQLQIPRERVFWQHLVENQRRGEERKRKGKQEEGRKNMECPLLPLSLSFSPPPLTHLSLGLVFLLPFVPPPSLSICLSACLSIWKKCSVFPGAGLLTRHSVSFFSSALMGRMRDVVRRDKQIVPNK